MAWPISLEAALRRSCAACASAIAARRASSSASSRDDSGCGPRFVSALVEGSAFSRIHLMSYMSVSSHPAVERAGAS